MYVPVEQVVDGVIRTLRESVLPDVDSAYARGQVYAVIDVLNNLRDRVEEKIMIVEGECVSLDAALGSALEALDAGSSAGVVVEFAERFDAAPDEPPHERIRALRALLVDMLTRLDELPNDRRARVREILAEHMAAQALRDVMLLKPSMLREISEG